MQSNSTSNTKIIVALIALIVTVFVAGFMIYNIKAKLPASHKFDGTVYVIKDDTLFTRGFFLDDNNKPISAVAIDGKTTTIQIKIDAGTKITRMAIFIPSAEELKAMNGNFDSSKFKKEESISDLAILQKDINNGPMGVLVKSDQNIAGKSSFTAIEINYRIEIQNIK